MMMFNRPHKTSHVKGIMSETKKVMKEANYVKGLIMKMDHTMLNVMEELYENEREGVRLSYRMASHVMPSLRDIEHTLHDLELAKTAAHATFEMKFMEAYLQEGGRFALESFKLDVQAQRVRLTDLQKSNQTQSEMEDQIEREVKRRLAARTGNADGPDGMQL